MSNFSEQTESSKKYGYKMKLDEANKDILILKFKIKGKEYETQLDVKNLSLEEIKEQRTRLYHKLLYTQELKSKMKEKRDILSKERKRLKAERKQKKQKEKQDLLDSSPTKL
jgi:hypothetical protein